ncbi:MAG: response regulator [Planctomycetaceae bacterium]|jgi:CheY-like chemotaxis protein|nr:response regulator [Planctomycetaceae bacterium]
MAVKSVYTTGEAAQICKVSQQTIIRCFDSGILHGFRVPRSRMRRIPRDSLIAFMQQEGIPTDALELGQLKILIAIHEPVFVKKLASMLDSTGHYAVRGATNGFDAGVMVGSYQPDLVVLDAALPGLNSKAICGKDICIHIRNNTATAKVPIICIGENLRKGKITELHEAGVNEFLSKPVDVETLTDRIGRMLGIHEYRKK